jgi:hypothetical protein
VPQPPKPEFSRLNTHNSATHKSKCPARLHALLRLLLVLGSTLGAFGQLQGHFMPLQEARRSPHGRRYVLHSWWELWWEPW